MFRVAYQLTYLVNVRAQRSLSIYTFTFKFGLYVNGNGTAVDKTTTEGNIMFVDYAAFASTEEKLEKLLAKDK